MGLEPMEEAAMLREFVLGFVQEQNLEDVMRVFYQVLSAHIPFTQMQFLSVDEKRQLVTPWVVMEDGNVVDEGISRRAPLGDTMRMELVREEGDLRVAVENDVSRNRLLDPYEDPFLKGMRSLLFVVLRADADHCFGISLQSPERDQYCALHADILLLMRAPLRVLVTRLHSRSQQSLLVESRQLMIRENSFALLKQCRGLAGVVRQIEVVADTSSTVLIQGETGVGKELVADSIHHLSARRGGPFVRVNSASIPDTLLDSALYGHEKGSFTSASSTHRGYFEQASGGTLFLDEVGELSPSAQASLLRVLETRLIQRVGGQRSVPIDVRVVAATHRDLRAMVEAGTFREDLWYRLTVFPLFVPPLRQRREDIAPLARHFYLIKTDELGLKQPAALTADALSALCAYSWPGNARQLSHVVERAMLVARGERASVLSFPWLREVKLSFAHGVKKGEPDMPEATSLSKRGRGTLGGGTLDEMAAEYIRHALEASGGRIHGPEGAAQALGVNPNTLRGRMTRLGIAFRKRDIMESDSEK